MNTSAPSQSVQVARILGYTRYVFPLEIKGNRVEKQVAGDSGYHYGGWIDLLSVVLGSRYMEVSNRLDRRLWE